MPHLTGQIVRGTILLVLGVGAAAWLVFTTVKHADDPARMAFKWVVTLGVLVFMFWKVAPLVGQGGYAGAFGGIPLAAVCGLALAIVWRHSISAAAAKPFASLYDGGSEPPEPRPAYSTAQARQKRGEYLEAVEEIRRQLARFPTDLEGHLLLAQIQAEDLKDLPAAELTIQQLCAQPGHAPCNIAFALYSMADWYLKIGKDREAARRSLERVIELVPESEFALTAAQRIAHLGTAEMLLVPEQRKKFTVPEGIHNLGLLRARQQMAPAERDPGEVAAEYVKHLEEYPLDMDAREKLAILYTDHFQRLDLATDQLEQMIAQPHQPAKFVVRCLNLLADLQIRSGADYDTVKATLERIIERDPKLAAAENARTRLSLLKLELKAKAKNQDVKMGTYEQRLGLKQGTRLPNSRP
jgi:tetratricopeptide (TPR) repeat protein